MVLRTEDLVKKYGKRTVVSHVSINVKQGEIVGLLGPNGAGKTTSFYMTVGLITPNEGRIFLDDLDITKYPVYKRAQTGIGYLAQEASVFRQMSVEDNIASVLEMTDKPLEYQKEKLELTRIYSIAGLLSREHPLIDERPFRSPHHTSTPQAIAGGGRNPRPGEITLAHKGVLFLDEMPEFSRASLELLRQPMEDKVIQIARASGTYNFPADFMLCAAMNPCPCGYYPDLNRCTCTAGEITHYMGKISRPLLDRIDISTEVPPVSFSQLHCGRKGENSAAIRKRVEKVQKIQEERYKDEKINFNGQLKSSLIDKFCPLTDSASRLLARAFEKIAFSARSYHRILKVARTIADMEGEEMIAGHHIGEALSYRAFDKDSVIK